MIVILLFRRSTSLSVSTPSPRFKTWAGRFETLRASWWKYHKTFQRRHSGQWAAGLSHKCVLTETEAESQFWKVFQYRSMSLMNEIGSIGHDDWIPVTKSQVTEIPRSRYQDWIPSDLDRLFSLLFLASRLFITSLTDKYWPRQQFAVPFKAPYFWQD